MKGAGGEDSGTGLEDGVGAGCLKAFWICSLEAFVIVNMSLMMFIPAPCGTVINLRLNALIGGRSDLLSVSLNTPSTTKLLKISEEWSTSTIKEL